MNREIFLKTILLILSLTTLVSCNLLSTHKEIKAFTGQEIRLPQKGEYFLGGKDTTSKIVDELKGKIVVYSDATECSTCEISNLYKWSEIIDIQKWTRDKVGVVFVMTPKAIDVAEIRRAIINNRQVEANIILDSFAEMPELNPYLPTKSRFKTFLLDQNNKVVLVGNPLGNEKMWELYKKEIARLCNE